MWEEEFDKNTRLKERHKVQKPKQYQVIMHNDDYTTMDFVVHVLMTVFKKPVEEATQIMIDVHKKGSGLCGVYTREIAETKIALVHSMARDAGFPLRCTMEEA